MAKKTSPPKPTPALLESFEYFWACYPNRKAKVDALKAWCQINPSAKLVENIVAAVHAQRRCYQWTKANGQFIPYPATWLRAGQWEDEEAEPLVPGIDPHAAWELVRRAVLTHGIGKTNAKRNGVWTDIDHEEEGLASLPPAVAVAAKVFGWARLCDAPTKDISFTSRDFMAAYEAVLQGERRQRILPPSSAAYQQIAGLGEKFGLKQLGDGK